MTAAEHSDVVVADTMVISTIIDARRWHFGVPLRMTSAITEYERPDPVRR